MTLVSPQRPPLVHSASARNGKHTLEQTFGKVDTRQTTLGSMRLGKICVSAILKNMYDAHVHVSNI